MSYDPARRAAQPSRAARRTGYRRDVGAHEDARDLVPPKLRTEIARMGGFARAAALYGYRTPPARPKPAPAAVAPQPRRPGRPPAIAGTPAQIKAARAARAAASRPARRAAAKAAKRGKP